jgi:hypothetical protein
MDSTSSWNESDPSVRRSRISLLDAWMIVAPLAIMAGYLLIRARISNYVFVARWLIHLFTAPIA